MTDSESSEPGDVGNTVVEAQGSFEKLLSLSANLDSKTRLALLCRHTEPHLHEQLRSHSVTKAGKTWIASFQRQWLTKFPWLVYSRRLKGGLCKSCILFPHRPEKGGRKGAAPGVLVLQPFEKGLTRALRKDGILTCHEQSSMHAISQQQTCFFIHNEMSPEHRADSLLLSKAAQNEEENKEVLRQIVRTVKFLGKQAMPFRGHRDDKLDFENLTTNPGNFIAALEYLSESNDTLQKHLRSAKKNAKYTSKTIQNELISHYAAELRKHLTHRIRENNLPYTVIADEATDAHANREILSVCLRYVDLSEPHIRECFLSFVHLERATASALYEKIVSILSDPTLSLDLGKIRGQAYDGAAVMSSSIRRVQAKVKEIAPLAIYTHCYRHCLNLSIASSCKISAVKLVFDLINATYFFFANSPTRQRFFELVANTVSAPTSRTKVLGLCKTRWAERHTCFEAFLELYRPIIICLDAIVAPQDYPDLCEPTTALEQWQWNRETNVKAHGLKASLASFPTIATFLTTKNVLDEVRCLASKLQKRDQDTRV